MEHSSAVNNKVGVTLESSRITLEMRETRVLFSCYFWGHVRHRQIIYQFKSCCIIHALAGVDKRVYFEDDYPVS